MQPSVTSVICFSWREIEASRGSNNTCFLEDGNDSSSESDDGIGNIKRILDNTKYKKQQFSQYRRGEHGELFHLGGELSRSERLVHGPISTTIRFSYR